MHCHRIRIAEQVTQTKEIKGSDPLIVVRGFLG